jgi:hypothetical protein
MVGSALRDDCDGFGADPLPELDILHHDVALQLPIVVEVEDPEVLPVWNTQTTLDTGARGELQGAYTSGRGFSC